MGRKVNNNFYSILREFYVENEKLIKYKKYDDVNKLAHETYFKLYPENNIENLYDFLNEDDTFITLSEKISFMAELAIKQNLRD